MPYRIAGIDVHKKMLAVVVADVEVDGDFQFERQKVGTTQAELRALADWLAKQEVEEVVMESTAQYWRPVWEALEQALAAAASGTSGRESPLWAHCSKARHPSCRSLTASSAISSSG
jgi:hypothetical protein